MGHIGVNYHYNPNGIRYSVYERFVEENTQKDLKLSKDFYGLIEYFVTHKDKLKGKEIILSNNFPKDKKKSFSDLISLLELD